MIQLSNAEERYLLAINELADREDNTVSTNAIAEKLDTSAASVSDMIRKLAEKGLLIYEKYHGVSISESGKKQAFRLRRNHHLWEVFLAEKLQFKWDEISGLAEKLGHIDSPLLINRLEEFLGFPKFNPHGSPIPDKDLELSSKQLLVLANIPEHQEVTFESVKDNQPVFLKYLDKINLKLGDRLVIDERIEFDGSLNITIGGNTTLTISKQAAENLLVS